MMTGDQDAVTALLTPESVRQRCHELFDAATLGEVDHFHLHLENLDAATELVLEEIRTNYPDGKVPFHSRWRHFELGGRDLWAELAAGLADVSPEEKARRRMDLAVVSVLLDAGAGAEWQYADAGTGLVYGRSEGLALASIRLVESGRLSRYGVDDPLRVDAVALEAISAADLAEVFQVSSENPLVGLEERAGLLNRLGAALGGAAEMFGRDGELRPGNLYDYLTARQEGEGLKAREILIALLRGIGSIWPEGVRLGDIPVGDVGHHPKIIRQDITNGVLPFHKLSQWMAYSLIEPLEEAGIRVVELDALTGLAEYRNGGLFIDTEVLSLKDADAAALAHHPKSPLVVEWRGLTVALLDKVAAAVRQHTGDDAESLPLASVLQGGTWTAGRKIAREFRPDGGPPLTLDSSGTIF
ncbi:DUF1688 family protein [Alphaproteobacteria bacterium LSUCC0684]